MKKLPPLPANRFLVAAAPCKNCLLSKDRIVSPKRAKEIVDTAVKTSGHFICHVASLNDVDVCCSSFHDNVPNKKSRMAESFGIVARVDLSGVDEEKTPYREFSK